MFNSDIENKIIDFIKKSPLGVTSSEIARFLGLNRMTITKYLAIIKEKALIDFKQLGMAKLWYIPVVLNKELYFNELISNLASLMKDETSKTKIKKAAIETAKYIDEVYRKFHGVDKLSLPQVIEALVNAQEKIGGMFVVLKQNNKEIILRNTKCPFGENVKKNPGLCATTSAIAGVITARNLGYSKVTVKKTIAKGAKECLIHIQLRRDKKKTS